MKEVNYPAKTRYQGTEAKSYLRRRQGQRKWQREQEIISALIQQLSPGTVLDIPIGTGRFLPAYDRSNHEVVGCDISQDMLNIARQQRVADPLTRQRMFLLQCEAESLPLQNNVVDYIVCTRFLNWLPQGRLNAILLQFSRVARHAIIVEIRLHTHAPLWRPILTIGKALTRQPVRVAGGLAALTIRELLDVARRATRQQTSGFVVHSRENFEALVSGCGLAIDHSVTVDSGELETLSLFSPLEIYVLVPKRV